MATPWEPFVGAFLALLQRWGTSGDIESAQRDQALITILTAANETRGYLEATDDGKPRSVEREHALSNLWDICGVTIRRFDDDLARRCELKGQFWRDPEEWTQTDINKARIGLETVYREAQYLLRLKIRPVRPKARRKKSGPTTSAKKSATRLI